MKKILFISLVFITGLLKAQGDFKSGYIINQSGDTLYGEIDYHGDFLMGISCRFRTSDNIITEFTPNNVNAFRFINGKYYVSREVNGKKVFLEYLIKGKVNIYYVRDEKGDHYFLDKENVNITEIPYEEGIKYIDDVKVFYESKKHIGVLSYYMQDAPEVLARINTMKRPQHTNLIKLAEDYHNAVCKDEICVIYEKEMPPMKLLFEPFWGYVRYSDQYTNELGGKIYIWIPRINEKLYLKSGFYYSKISVEGGEINRFKIPLQIQYEFSTHKIVPYVSYGINIWSERIIDYEKVITHALCLNGGLYYKMTEKLALNANYSSEFTPFTHFILYENTKFGMYSWSVAFGLTLRL